VAFGFRRPPAGAFTRKVEAFPLKPQNIGFINKIIGKSLIISPLFPLFAFLRESIAEARKFLKFFKKEVFNFDRLNEV
jgi:hypothetical protein